MAKAVLVVLLGGSAESLLVSCFHLTPYETAKVEMPSIFGCRKRSPVRDRVCSRSLMLSQAAQRQTRDVHDEMREAMQVIKLRYTDRAGVLLPCVCALMAVPPAACSCRSVCLGYALVHV